LIGGVRFEGEAVASSDGTVKEGRFFLLGPSALFQSEDGSVVGSAEQRLGSTEPTVLPFSDPQDTAAAAALLRGEGGRFPLDPTLGKAHKIESTEDTLWEHVQKGGPVMVPIFVLAGLSLLVALYKWILNAVSRGDGAEVERASGRIKGPVGRMLGAGVAHIRHPRQLIEEVMYERVLESKLKLQRLLPFIAITAAAAPLLGLLGTVTGIINTFRMITVFGTGDVKTLSGGISEALITTKFGLIVAIPSLLLHAFLSRKVRGVIDQMEKSAMSFVNEVSKAAHRREERQKHVRHAQQGDDSPQRHETTDTTGDEDDEQNAQVVVVPGVGSATYDSNGSKNAGTDAQDETQTTVANSSSSTEGNR